MKKVIHDKVLPRVERPSQYLGTELNSAHKDRGTVDLRVALAFPDLYELGLGNLGLQILYGVLNGLPWCWAERTCAPAPDMAALLRDRDLPLFMLESKDPIRQADLVGFSLQSELTYTTVLDMLDLARIPLRSAERGNTHPLVCAGGPCAFNPEPLAPFIDFFVIGDGEDVVLDVACALRGTRGASRADRLGAVEAVPGVYVPARCDTDVLPDGTIVPRPRGGVRRRLVRDMDHAHPATAPVVPFMQLVHDRAGVEVMRGCARGCRFCQAGMTSRPVRERSPDTVANLLEEAVDRTGHEDVSLVSLSTCDHSRVGALLGQAARFMRGRDTGVSLPSLHIGSASVELADSITGVRRGGLTLAPEAATQRLRDVVNKDVTEEDLLLVTRRAFELGWNHVKLYFMIGLPTETDEDVDAIADLCQRVLEAGREANRKAQVFTGISTFVPKPHTPFQWCRQISLDETRRLQDRLRERLGAVRGVKFGRHDPRESHIEGLLARGDRRAAGLVESAWRHGARLDSSTEHLNFAAWEAAVRETRYPVDQALGERPLDSDLPWDHIDTLVSKEWLASEYQRALEARPTPDCRIAGCSACGARNHEAEACAAMLEAAASARARVVEDRGAQAAEHREPEPAMRVRLRVGREAESRFLSNREWMNVWVRALRRIAAPVAYSQGFHAHPKAAFSAAPPVGEASEAEYLDVTLRERVDPTRLLEELRGSLPPSIRAYEVEETPLRGPALMNLVSGFAYDIDVPAPPDDLRERVAALSAAAELVVERRVKERAGRQRRKAVKPVDVRSSVKRLSIVPADGPGARLHLEVDVSGAGKTVRPAEVLVSLGIDPADAVVMKRRTVLAADPVAP